MINKSFLKICICFLDGASPDGSSRFGENVGGAHRAPPTPEIFLGGPFIFPPNPPPKKNGGDPCVLH